MVYTMRDVANRAGVSPATVSRVLSSTHYISEETRERVLEVVRELKYYKNVHARRLATGQSDLFGLVISEIANLYFPEVIRGFQAMAWERGLDVLLLNTEYSTERTQSVIRKLVESDVRGVAIMTSSIDDTATPALVEAGIGVVFCNLCSPDKLVSNITIDYHRGVLQAVKHVTALGHRRAAIISGPEISRAAANIRQTLIAGLKQHGMAPFPVTSCDYHVDAGSSAVRDILSVPEIPTVIFCGSDLIAMGAMSALEEAGVRIPEDVSIVGIDDIPFASLSRPPLTTISVPREQLGVTAFQALDKMLKLKRKRGAEYTLETNLVVRGSTAPATQKKP
ncbi:MAG: LacI family DNA-binding transcriptional regulator [Acidobacteriaceae bacterium]